MSTNTKFDSEIQVYAGKVDVPPALIKAIITCESSWDSFAYRPEITFWEKYIRHNPKYQSHPLKDQWVCWGSWGLMQLLFSTALDLGYKETHPWRLCYPLINIELGAKYLASRYSKFGEWSKAISAYNAGSPTDKNKSYVEKVTKWWDRYEAEMRIG